MIGSNSGIQSQGIQSTWTSFPLFNLAQNGDQGTQYKYSILLHPSMQISVLNIIRHTVDY